MYIVIKNVTHMEQVGNQEYSLEFDTVDLSKEDQDVLHRLYPHVIERAYSLLDTEVILKNVK